MFRYLFYVGCGLVFATLLCASASGTDSEEQRAWICFAEMPTEHDVRPRVHVQATINVDPKILKVISSFVDRAVDQPMVLVSYGDADVKIPPDRFIVVRIMDKKFTVTTRSLLPEASRRLLTKRLTRMGYEVEFVEPEKLLLRTNATDERSAEFIVPFRAASEE